MLNSYWQRTVVVRNPRRPRSRRGPVCIAGLAGLALLAACTQSNSQTSSIFGGLLVPHPEEPVAKPAAAPAPVRPEPERNGCGSAAQCKVMLKTMIDSPDRGWIGQRPAPDAYADGTRLFAYRALRKQLTCNELTAAVGELQAASKSLGGSVSGMSPDQLSRTRALSGQVEGELAREREGRCKT
ncbi:MAG TPA: hypothetical protein VG758_07390 [Hyphomicrobiaceae bacterium]|nr:hypothetical protein [Hyphomicrobiaceae bacterium]